MVPATTLPRERTRGVDRRLRVFAINIDLSACSMFKGGLTKSTLYWTMTTALTAEAVADYCLHTTNNNTRYYRIIMYYIVFAHSTLDDGSEFSHWPCPVFWGPCENHPVSVLRASCGPLSWRASPQITCECVCVCVKLHFSWPWKCFH